MKKPLNKKVLKAFSAAFALSIGVCSVLGGTAVAANCTHEFSNSWSGDGKNHWHAATCGDDIVKDMEAHNFKDGKCTVCGEAEPVKESVHKHTYDMSKWYGDSVNHWRASTCEHAIIKDVAEHTFEDGKCTVCGEPEPISADTGHKHTFNAEWASDEVNHWHSSDSACGHNVVKGIAKHTMEGGVCTVCNYLDANLKPSEKISKFGGYNESLFAEWAASSVTGVKVSYQLVGGSWTDVDSRLIRMKNSTTARFDAVGLKAGKYNIKIENGGETLTASSVTVNAYDRSGYAHFGASEGVGAYNNDGTPKSGAKIIYVTEETKNTVEFKIGSNTYKGIVAILGNAYRSNDPIIVRVLGQISAATWKEGNVTYTKTTSNTVDGTTTGNLKEEYIIGKNGEKLPTDSSKLTQDELIKGGYNELDTSTYSVLNGLSSKATYKVDSSTKFGAYDSAWNNCSIPQAKNVTLEGIGTDAELFQWGLTWASCNSIEVRNLTFDDYTEDACSFEGSKDSTTVDGFDSKRLWVHNCTFNEGKNYWDVSDEQDKHEGDGATDFKKLSYVTISYNHYYNNHKTGLIGGSDTQKTANVTFHHNFYDRCSSRLPLGRQANMHMYNNYYYKSSGTNMSIRAGAYALIEYCYFDNANVPIETKTGDSKKGVVKLFNCTAVGKSIDTSKNNITVVTDRTAKVANDNIFNQNFDTDVNAFYYDAANKKSAVTSIITDVDEVKTEIPKLAGANRDN